MTPGANQRPDINKTRGAHSSSRTFYQLLIMDSKIQKEKKN
jgi:hypothetical protein